MARRKKGSSLFIQKAIEKPGTFHAYCQREGYSKVNGRCIQKGLKSKNRLTRQRANLAKNLARIRPR